MFFDAFKDLAVPLDDPSMVVTSEVQELWVVPKSASASTELEGVYGLGDSGLRWQRRLWRQWWPWSRAAATVTMARTALMAAVAVAGDERHD